MPTTWRSREFFPAFLCLLSIFSKRREGMRAHLHLFCRRVSEEKKLVFFLFFHKEGIKEVEKSALLSSSSIFLLIFLKQRWLETKEKNECSLLHSSSLTPFPKVRREWIKGEKFSSHIPFPFPLFFLKRKRWRKKKKSYFFLVSVLPEEREQGMKKESSPLPFP